MLKKINVSELRLGMHLHELCGAWLDHPFWKTKFVLRDPVDLQKLRASSVTECWIDTSKGFDVAVPSETPAVRPLDGPATVRLPAEPALAPTMAPAKPEAPVAPARVGLQDELERAGALMKQSRRAVMSLFSEARMGKTMDAENCASLVGEITSSVWRNPEAFISLARLKTHDDYSYMHSVAVCALMVSLARQLGRGEAEAREAGMAGLLHDMGKALMPLDVLNKPGKLTDAEYGVMKSHPERGHEMLRDGKGVTPVALDVCLHHHERPDGRGYPYGLKGDALSLAARMGSVCDVYDAITSNRPYKSGWDPAESIARMAEWSKAGQFDPAMLAAFVKSLGIYPTGSLVRMESGRLGVVIEQTEGSLVKPRVKIFFSTRSQMPVAVEVLDTSLPHCGDRIVGRESNSQWKFSHLDQLWTGLDARGKPV